MYRIHRNTLSLIIYNRKEQPKGYLVSATGGSSTRGIACRARTTAPNSEVRQETKQTARVDLHHGTAEETDADHEQPAGNSAEAPDDVSQRDIELVLGEQAVNGVERTLVRRNLLIGLLGVNLVDSLGSDGGRVEVDGAEGSESALLASRLFLGDLVVLHGWGAGGPGGAQNLVGFAVQVSEVRGGGVSREEEDGFLVIMVRSHFGVKTRRGIVLIKRAYLEGLLGLGATTETGLVATSGEDQPVLFLGAGSEDALIVVHGYRGDALLRDLLGQLLDRGDGSCCRHVRLDLVEPALHAVGERNLLLGHGQGREKSDERRETHLEG